MKNKKKIRVAVLMGGSSSEREVSINSGKNVLNALRTGNNLQRYIAVSIAFRQPQELIKKLEKIKCNVVFPVLHGKFGEDGGVQALLEALNLPYVGSGVLASALCMDKILSSELMQKYGLFVPRVLAPRSSSFPRSGVVVKPRASGSSVGISIVRNKKDLNKAIKLAEKSGEGEAIIQEFIPGTELTCGVVEFTKGRLSRKPAFRALPVTEIIPNKSNGAKFFDYKAKYTEGGSEEITPARISSKLTKQIQDSAILAHKILGCRHISRSDFIVKGTKLYYLETNTMPGMTKTSLIPQAIKVAGMDMPELCDLLIKSALH